MRKLILLLALMTLIPVALAATCESYGAGLTLAETTPAAAILDAPDEFAGKQVRVEGEVTAVCEMAGCWMSIVADDGGRELRVKVEDGVIVFPTSARGKKAIAEGEVAVKDMSREQYESWQRHMAEEQGDEFDPASIGDGPYRLVQISGTGAEICSD